jgi:hypothetical protein
MASSRICSIPDCGKRHDSRGWCSAHVWRWKKYGDPLGGPPPRNRWTSDICCIPDCGKLRKPGAGMCTAHYLRNWRHGDPLAGRLPVGKAEEFALSLRHSETNECIQWPYTRDRQGYGRISFGGHQIASRFICEMTHGKPPTPEHEAAHSCGNGHLGCVNPKHLSWKTHAENMGDIPHHRRMRRSG